MRLDQLKISFLNLTLKDRLELIEGIQKSRVTRKIKPAVKRAAAKKKDTVINILDSLSPTELAQLIERMG